MGQRWTVRIERDNLDPGFLMWNMRRRIALDRLPPRRIVVSFKYGGVPARYRGPRLFWLVLERTQAELCIKDLDSRSISVWRPISRQWPRSGWAT